MKKYLISKDIELAIGEIDGRICLSDWVRSKTIQRKAQQLAKKYKCGFEYKDSSLLTEAAQQLDQYMRGERKHFDLPLVLNGSEFQIKVWKALQTIPYGTTWSYKELAAYVGKPEGYRAVANANGANLLPIIIPCHRVIANDGSIGGYGLGAQLKSRLLGLETIVSDNFELVG